MTEFAYLYWGSVTRFFWHLFYFRPNYRLLIQLFNFNSDVNIKNYVQEITKEDFELELDTNYHNNFELSLVKENYDILKNNSDNNMNIEIMNTFQQTFEDPNFQMMNYDCEMEGINYYDDDLCLRK